MPNTHLVRPGSPVMLANTATRADDYHDSRKAAEKEFRQLRSELIELQQVLYAEGKRKVLVVLQAMDAGGKDGTIRHVFAGVNPQGVRVSSFKKPSSVELDHDFLWRIHRVVPGKGMFGVFNRSHYEDVLVVRVDRIVAEDIWRPRYEIINQFEQHLTESGTTILKFFLHISRDEQKERFQDRLDRPDKHWKFDSGDLQKREQWDQYQGAFEDMLKECSTVHAPWYVIPSDQKWYRNLAIMKVLVKTLEGMNLQYPLSDDFSNIEIP